MSDRWFPAISTCHYQRKPPTGVLIGYRYDVWRVERVEDVNPGNWSDRARDEWLNSNMPDPWRYAPFRVIVTRPEGGRKHMLTVEPWHYITWDIVPEDYAVCVRCGKPAPCREYLGAKQAAHEMARAEEEMALPDGYCPACREPISTRQKTHRFPGANLLNPLGSPDVHFHARRKCRHGAVRYEEMWITADPSRTRSLLTLKCSGSVITHADGSAECVGRDGGGDCPNIYAHHSRYAACYIQSAGCPRLECMGETQHGCHPSKGLRTDGSRP